MHASIKNEMTTLHNTEAIQVSDWLRALGPIHLQLAGTFRLFYIGEVAQNSKIDTTKKS